MQGISQRIRRHEFSCDVDTDNVAHLLDNFNVWYFVYQGDCIV